MTGSTEAFGNAVNGASETTLYNRIRGIVITIPNDGKLRVPSGMRFRIRHTGAATYNFAVYKVTPDSFVLEVEDEWTIESTVPSLQWFAAYFHFLQSWLVPGATYVIVGWSSNSTAVISYDASTNAGRYHDETYGTWPSALSPTTDNLNVNLALDCYVDDGDDIRKSCAWYMRSDTHTINGKLANKFARTNTTSAGQYDWSPYSGPPPTLYIGLKLYERTSGGSEVLVSGTNPICVANKTYTEDGTWEIEGPTATFTNIKLGNGSTLLAKVVADIGVALPSTVIKEFIVDNNATTGEREQNIDFDGVWSGVKYWVSMSYDFETEQYYVSFLYGSAARNSRVSDVSAAMTLIGELTRLVNTTINWDADTDTKFISLCFKKKTKSQLEAIIDALSDWQEVIRWSARSLKLGIERETVIKAALTNAVMVNGLPRSHDAEPDYWEVADGDLLYGFYWADKWSHETSKWNKLTAKNNLIACFVDAGNSFLIYYSPTAQDEGTDRFYDENGQTMRAFMLLYEFFEYADALEYAEAIWDWVNTYHWTGGTTYPFEHYKYKPGEEEYECSGGPFLQLGTYLKWLKSDISNWDRLKLDMYNRGLRLEWYSPNWLDTTSNLTPTASTMHMTPGNTQRRLGETLSMWGALLGVYQLLDSTCKTAIKTMIEGKGTTYAWHPAWMLLRNDKTNLYDAPTDKFKTVSGVGSSDVATAQAAFLMFFLGILPQTGALAVPNEELYYLEPYAIVDADLFALDITNRKVTMAVGVAGTFKFLYGTSKPEYEFTSTGIYEVTFASDWNSISSVSKLSDLPTNRRYLGAQIIQLDFTAGVGVASTPTQENTFNVSKDAAVSAGATKATEATFNLPLTAGVGAGASQASAGENTFNVPKTAYINIGASFEVMKGIMEMWYTAPTGVSGPVAVESTFNMAKNAPVNITVVAILQTMNVLEFDAVVAVDCTLEITWIHAGAQYIELNFAADVNTLAPLVIDTSFNIPKTAAVNISATFNIQMPIAGITLPPVVSLEIVEALAMSISVRDVLIIEFEVKGG